MKSNSIKVFVCAADGGGMGEIMKAALLYGKEDMRVEEVEIPEINDDEVLLKVMSASICGTDVRMYKNGMEEISEEHPLIIGHEISGVIDKVGKNVIGYKTGLRVVVAPNMGCGICDDCIRGNSHMCKDYRALGINLNGGFAEYVKIPAQAVRAGNIMIINDNVSFSEAAIIEPLSCVYNGIEQCNIKQGDYVLVIGAGPIGVMHAMMAKMSGAARVYINDLQQGRLDECKGIDSSFITIKDDLKESIMAATNGRGMDVIITACPVPSVQQSALEMAANYGRVCLFGGLPDQKKLVPLNSNLIHYKQLIVTGSTRSNLRQFRKALEFVTAGIIDVKKLITKEVSLDNIQEGMSCAMASQGFKNVIVMQ